MHLSTSILGALALAGAALASQISVFTGPTCDGAPTGIESGIFCNNCYTLNQAYGAVQMDAFPEDSICQALAFIEALDALEEVVGSNLSSRSVTAIPGSSIEVLSNYVENETCTVNEAVIWACWESCLLIAVQIGEDRPRTRAVDRERFGLEMWPTVVQALSGRKVVVNALESNLARALAPQYHGPIAESASSGSGLRGPFDSGLNRILVCVTPPSSRFRATGSHDNDLLTGFVPPRRSKVQLRSAPHLHPMAGDQKSILCRSRPFDSGLDHLKGNEDFSLSYSKPDTRTFVCNPAAAANSVPDGLKPIQRRTFPYSFLAPDFNFIQNFLHFFPAPRWNFDQRLKLHIPRALSELLMQNVRSETLPFLSSDPQLDKESFNDVVDRLSPDSARHSPATAKVRSVGKMMNDLASEIPDCVAAQDLWVNDEKRNSDVYTLRRSLVRYLASLKPREALAYNINSAGRIIRRKIGVEDVHKGRGGQVVIQVLAIQADPCMEYGSGERKGAMSSAENEESRQSGVTAKCFAYFKGEGSRIWARAPTERETRGWGRMDDDERGRRTRRMGRIEKGGVDSGKEKMEERRCQPSDDPDARGRVHAKRNEGQGKEEREEYGERRSTVKESGDVANGEGTGAERSTGKEVGSAVGTVIRGDEEARRSRTGRERRKEEVKGKGKMGGA
ncbi:hypothetical protein DFH09DRAFT_1406082 [Mycena vulgaris]|nr:hypothetical protein DFH09DRAFT_1406082 [Mycena vulgaris]